jgi:hypothetical protein
MRSAYVCRWLGVDNILLIDQGSKQDPQACVQDWIDEGFVEWLRLEGPHTQVGIYAGCIARHRLDYSWIAFIDVDEYLIVRECAPYCFVMYFSRS